MNIVICDDDVIYRRHLSNMIDGILMRMNSNSQVVLETDDPAEILDYARDERQVTLYFLDIKLKNDISGLEIAEEIRKNDEISLIVIITNYPDNMSLVYEHKVAALDFIYKGDTLSHLERVRQCIEIAETRQHVDYEECINIENYNEKFSVPYNDIYYIDTITGSHKLTIHTDTAIYNFYGKIKEMPAKLDSRFTRCHKSVIVNTDKVIGVNKSEHQILLLNGTECSYSIRYFSPDKIYR